MYAVYSGTPNYRAADISAGAGINPDLITPNAAGVYPAIQHSTGLPPAPSFAGSVNGMSHFVLVVSRV